MKLLPLTQNLLRVQLVPEEVRLLGHDVRVHLLQEVLRQRRALREDPVVLLLQVVQPELGDGIEGFTVAPERFDFRVDHLRCPIQRTVTV